MRVGRREDMLCDRPCGRFDSLSRPMTAQQENFPEMNLTKLASLGLAALVLTTSFAQAGGNGTIVVNKDVLRLAKVAACQLGSGEFPNDVWVINKGAGVLKAGQSISWSVPFANAKGTYVLTADLAPTKSVFLSNVIPGSVEAGHDCKAKAL
jgi:hypothetical protein